MMIQNINKIYIIYILSQFTINSHEITRNMIICNENHSSFYYDPLIILYKINYIMNSILDKDFY